MQLEMYSVRNMETHIFMHVFQEITEIIAYFKYNIQTIGHRHEFETESETTRHSELFYIKKTGQNSHVPYQTVSLSQGRVVFS